MEKPKPKRPLGSPRPRSEVGIKTDIKGIGSGGMDLIHLAQERGKREALVNTEMDLRVPYDDGKSVPG